MADIQYYEEIKSLPQEEVVALYDSVGWSTYTKSPDDLMTALANSTYVVVAMNGDDVVGLARCISDDISICYYQDILIHPDFQRQGIARKLLGKCMDRFSHVRTHLLLTDDEERQAEFYKSLGFKNSRQLIKTVLNCFVKMNNIDLR